MRPGKADGCRNQSHSEQDNRTLQPHVFSFLGRRKLPRLPRELAVCVGFREFDYAAEEARLVEVAYRTIVQKRGVLLRSCTRKYRLEARKSARQRQADRDKQHEP